MHSDLKYFVYFFGMLLMIISGCIYYGHSVVTSPEYIFEHKVLTRDELITKEYRIIAVNPPKHVSIDVENIVTGTKVFHVTLGKHMNDWKDYLWVGRVIKLQEPKEPRSSYTFYCPLEDIRNLILNPHN